MAEVNLYTKDGKLITRAIIEADQPDIILFGDRFFIYNQKKSQYREGYMVVACLEEDKFLCHVPPIGPKDRCLKCHAPIDTASGKRYCEEHAIGVCGEHQNVDCVHCGYNKRSGDLTEKK